MPTPDAYELTEELVIPLVRLTEGPVERSIVADEEARARIAERLGIDGVRAFSGAVRLTKSGDLVTVEGRLEAELDRRCVVSLEPVEERVADDFAETLTTAPGEDGADIEDELMDLDAPEPIRRASGG